MNIEDFCKYFHKKYEKQIRENGEYKFDENYEYMKKIGGYKQYIMLIEIHYDNKIKYLIYQTKFYKNKEVYKFIRVKDTKRLVDDSSKIKYTHEFFTGVVGNIPKSYRLELTDSNICQKNHKGSIILYEIANNGLYIEKVYSKLLQRNLTERETEINKIIESIFHVDKELDECSEVDYLLEL